MEKRRFRFATMAIDVMHRFEECSCNSCVAFFNGYRQRSLAIIIESFNIDASFYQDLDDLKKTVKGCCMQGSPDKLTCIFVNRPREQIRQAFYVTVRCCFIERVAPLS